MRYYLIISLWAIFIAPFCYASNSAKIFVSVNIEEDDKGLPRLLDGEISVKGFQPGRERCFYLPYNDIDRLSFKTPSSHFDVVINKTDQKIDSGSLQEVSSPWMRLKLSLDTPYLLRIPPSVISSKDETIKLSFKARAPHLPNGDINDWFYDGFYPKPLEECPESGLASIYFKPFVDVQIKTTIKYPRGWQLITPGTLSKESLPRYAEVNLRGHKFAFALSRYLKIKSFVIDDVTAELHYKSEQFLSLVPTIKQAFSSHRKWFGTFPYKKLVIVETAEVQESGIPGFIAFNRPRQDVFKSLQKDVLNWQHWMITSLIANQWSEATLRPESIDNRWFHSGIAEFATLAALKEHNKNYNLFSQVNKTLSRIRFNYQQIQDMSAAVLRRNNPFSPLTNGNLETKTSIRLQNPLLFVKHAIALRYLKSAFGEEHFAILMQSFLKKYRFKMVRPKDFYDHFFSNDLKISKSQKSNLANYLKQWWTEGGWPDFAIESFEKKKASLGKWHAKVIIRQDGELLLPINTLVVDSSGKRYLARSEKIKNSVPPLWQVNFITDNEPEIIEIDPYDDLFDSNRFNNTNKLPGVNFFPGSATTLSDSGYTVIWLPYFFRRPAEPVSIAIQAGVFRYIQSGLFLGIEAAPWDDLYAFQILRRYNIAKHALDLEANISQDYERSRNISFSVLRDPLFLFNPRLSLMLRLSHRETVGVDNSEHQTATVGFKVAPITDTCYGHLYTQLEHAPEGLAANFSYNRHTGNVRLACDIFSTSRIESKVFAGEVRTEDQVPEEVLFRVNDVDEAGMRLDVTGIERSKKVITSVNDLLLPLYFPIPGNTLILSRKIKFDLFYDQGQSFDEDRNRVYRDYGFGVLIPFGGDLVGAGALALTKLSLFTVLYTEADGEKSKVPRFLFDISGEL